MSKFDYLIGIFFTVSIVFGILVFAYVNFGITGICIAVSGIVFLCYKLHTISKKDSNSEIYRYDSLLSDEDKTFSFYINVGNLPLARFFYSQVKNRLICAKDVNGIVEDSSYDNIEFSKHYLFDRCFIVFDSKREMVHHFYYDKQGLHNMIIRYSSILEISIEGVNDGKLETSLSSTIKRAAVGGFVAGTAGAVVGAVTTQKEKPKYIRDVFLYIRTNMIELSHYRIQLNEGFFERKEKDSKEYNDFVQLASDLTGSLLAVIDMNNKQSCDR